MSFLPQSCRSALLLLLGFTFFLSACSKSIAPKSVTEEIKPRVFDDDVIRRAAEQSLGTREGTIIVLNPHDGRIRTVLNPRLAFEQAFPPGSTIKPFTALAAMRSGLANDETRIQCGRTFQRGEFQVNCSHKRVNNSFKLHHAIAYSCNYYFSTMAERMNASGFFSMLNSFGFGARTGVNASEASGDLKQGDWQVSTAIGNDENVLVTPVQLLMGFTALLNGGHLLRPRVDESNNFIPQEIRQINLNPQHRAVLIEGMKGCTDYGSGTEAGFNQLPYDVIGKTGTSGSSNGFRTQGWFISFLLHRKNAKNVEPVDLNFAALVFLKRAHGAEAAQVAGEFYRRLIYGNEPPGAATKEELSNSPEANSKTIRVHLVREARTVAVSLEDYVQGILAAESSVETELEALKAQAVVSRTFALRNLQRHKSDGYDFCSLTHCQRFVPALADHNKALVIQAASETAGQVIEDDRRQIADVYFHAACGGMTTNLEAIWGAPSPSYLRSVNDDYCTTMSHKSWVQNIPIKDLLRALQSDERSNVGNQLEAIFITRRDQSGRAEFVTLEGSRRKQLRGWDFALIVNRVLGWNMLKSARFEVNRIGATFSFRGSGFGHGLGLCQEGAHVMARRGMNYQAIIQHYLPGTTLRKPDSVQLKPARFPLKDSLPKNGTDLAGRLIPASYYYENAQSARATVASEHFRISYPAGTSGAAAILPLLEGAYNSLKQRFQMASIAWSSKTLIQIQLHRATADFVAATGQPSWVAAASRDNTIHLQPLSLLQKRGILNSTLRHELTHVALESLRSRQAARWLSEGLAIHFAGEGKLYANPVKTYEIETVEKQLAAPRSAAEMKQLYANAYAEVKRLIRVHGEAKMWQKAINP
ncbi:MAG: SpoIID/LytB domain-containing protein [Acidobacteria bacterium]|nr:SpoIID/LytB domain-containing protein [Acidobacteriota bacterium]